MTAERILEWDGDKLWVRVGQRRKFVGVVVLSSFGKTWGVFVRGQHKQEVNTEEEARRRLEAYAL